MKKLFVALGMFSLMTGLWASGNTAKKSVGMSKTLKVDTSSSKLVWTGTKVTGKHWGEVKVKSGNLKYKGPDFVGGEFVIDMGSINVKDIENPEWNKKLENHLKNGDFFDVGNHKEAKLVIKDVMFGKGGVYNITADLTIKGITKTILFDANVDKMKNGIKATADIKFDRTKFDIKYKSGNFFKGLGDKMIHDEVSMKVTLVAKK